MLRRPIRVRRPSPSSASCGRGSEYTVKPRGSSNMKGLSARGDELEPDIEDGAQGTQGPPLEGITVMFRGAAGGLGPLAQQAFRRLAGLLPGQVQQRQTCFGPELGQVDILPDGAEAGCGEFV